MTSRKRASAPEFRQRRRDFLRNSSIAAGSILLPARVVALTKAPERTLDFRCGLPSGVSFARESVASLHASAQAAGTRVPRGKDALVAASQPRFIGEADQCAGLLLEGQTLNRIRNASALTPKSFALSKGGDALVASQEKGPDGSGGVVKLHRGPRGSGSLVDIWAAPAADGDFCTASVWLRSPSGSGTWRLRLSDFKTYSDSTAVVDVGPEWKRYALTLTLQLRDDGAKRFALALSEPALKPGQTEDARPALSEVLMWGPQVESGPDASSYVPTNDTPTARAADIASMPSAWIPAAGGITFHLPQGGRRGAVIIDANGDAGEKSASKSTGLRLHYTNSGWLAAQVAGVTATGFGDRTSDPWVRVEWSPNGVQIFSGKSENSMALQASSTGRVSRMDLGERVRLGMSEAGSKSLNRPLALVKLSNDVKAVAKVSPPSVVPSAYRVSFEDDFNDTDLSRINENASGGNAGGKKNGAPAWRSRYRHERNKTINAEKQIYVDPAYAGNGTEPLGLQPFSIADSVLTIRAERTPQASLAALDNKRYISGCITTELTHWQTYGYFEMRARLPRGKGFWPAFWLLPKRETWPPEIDIVESSGARPNGVHVGFIDKTMKYGRETGAWIDNEIDVSDGFHLYALEWTKEKIIHLIDGKAVFQLGPHGIHEDMYLLANLALGSKDAGWIPDPDDSTPLPGKFEIDYIRAYSKT